MAEGGELPGDSRCSAQYDHDPIVRECHGFVPCSALEGRSRLRSAGVWMHRCTDNANLRNGVSVGANPGGFWSAHEVQTHNQGNGRHRDRGVHPGPGRLDDRRPARSAAPSESRRRFHNIGTLIRPRSSPISWRWALVFYGIILSLGLAAANAGAQEQRTPRVYSLAGEWGVMLDAADTGVRDRIWQTKLPDKIRLPGTTDTGHLGAPNQRPPSPGRLDRLFEFSGPVWYQREVTIPYAWRRRRITLFLERCQWETKLWLDGTYIGARDSLSTPHVYDITRYASPGRHTLTLRVDNRMKVNIGWWASAISNEAQTNWNGIIGRIELQGTARVWIEEIRTVPDRSAGSVLVRARIGNIVEKDVTVDLVHTASLSGAEDVRSVTVRGRCPPGMHWIEGRLPIGPNADWSEFTPRVWSLQVHMKATDGVTTWVHDAATSFGMRTIETDGQRILVNGRRVFLRGTVERCVFPLTGFPPMDVEPWRRLFAVAGSYGLNHIRFHSWCPPEAAFRAADEAGFLLQIEAPAWVADIGKDPPRDAFLREEMVRILDTYGNHPSFGLFCLGNELSGDPAFLQRLVRAGIDRDPRRLYTSSTAFSFGALDQYNVAAMGSALSDGTRYDFRDVVATFAHPTIAYRVGEWSVYPDLKGIGKYTGTLRAGYLLTIQESLGEHGLLPLAASFTQATGKAVLALYKQDIEAQLRTPNQSGFQLQDLHDYPGHGLSSVGMLDSFWDPKGFVTADEFRRFCGPTTPLVRLSRRTYRSSESLAADIEVAHYGPEDLSDVAVQWGLATRDGTVIGSGALHVDRIPTGALTTIGRIETPLKAVQSPASATLTVSLEGRSVSNAWNLWIYPSEPKLRPENLMIARAWHQGVADALQQGKAVLLLTPYASLRRSLPGSFTPVVGSPLLNPGGALTMSLLCDPNHPALAGFPTEAWTDWQWRDILSRARSAVLPDTGVALQPIVRIVDNFTRNLNLALLFEARVGSGKLLVCTSDLETQADGRPAAAALLNSLIAYAASDRFAPKVELTPADISALFVDPTSDPVRSRYRPDSVRAELHARAATNVSVGARAAWIPGADTVFVRMIGFDYSIEGETWRGETDSAWTENTRLVINLTVPSGFSGFVSIHLLDATREGRSSQVEIDGRLAETVTDYGPEGVWLRLAVGPTETEDGRIVVTLRPEGVSDMVSELLVTPRQSGTMVREPRNPALAKRP